jgi:secreted trypsin-like serine protease
MRILVVFASVLALVAANPSRGGRIVNGRDATRGEAPFMIQFRQTPVGQTESSHFCGGL